MGPVVEDGAVEVGAPAAIGPMMGDESRRSIPEVDSDANMSFQA